MKRLSMLIVVGAVALGACASGSTPSAEQAEDLIPVDDSVSPVLSEAPIPVEPDEGTGDGAAPLDLPVVSPDLAAEVEIALADLTERIGDDRVIEVIAAHRLTWPDGSLGCPQPDMAYTQALVDGYRIEFADGGYLFIYHGASGSDPFLCVEGEEGSSGLVRTPAAPPPPSTTPPIEVLPTDPAKDDEPTEQFGGPSGPPDE